MDPHDLNKELLRRREAIRQAGGPKAAQRQHAKGKLTARERIDRLLDTGSFLEVDPYITHRHSAFGLDEKQIPGDAVVVGDTFGKIRAMAFSPVGKRRYRDIDFIAFLDQCFGNLAVEPPSARSKTAKRLILRR